MPHRPSRCGFIFLPLLQFSCWLAARGLARITPLRSDTSSRKDGIISEDNTIHYRRAKKDLLVPRKLHKKLKMDVIVKWRDGTENCVSVKDLKCLRKGDKFTIGTAVKMLFKRRWYFGVIVMTEKDYSYAATSENLTNINNESSSDESNGGDPFHDSDASNDNDPDYNPEPKKKRQLLSVLNTSVNCFEHSSRENGDNSKVNEQHTRLNIFDSTEALPTVQKNLPSNPSTASVSSNETVCLEDNIAEIACDATKTLQENICSNVRRDSNSSDATICSFSILQDNIEDSVTSTNAAQIFAVEDKYIVQSCEVNECVENVFSSCFRCSILLCWNHFDNKITCNDHQQPRPISPLCDLGSNVLNRLMLEDFTVEGSPREIVIQKKEKISKKELNKRNKNLGKEYTTQITNKIIPDRQLGPVCNVENCKRINRECGVFDANSRKTLFDAFWALGSLQSQREFIARHIEKMNTKQKTAGPESKRKNTIIYYLHNDGERKKVCRTFFLNTLAVGERTVKTAIEKLLPTGIQEKDRRGGRTIANIQKDDRAKALVEEHLKRFPRVESHYCRANSTREYLHSDLTIRKMHQMLVEDLQEEPKPSLSLYRKLFKCKNLSFHRPKKDQCSLCSTYREGTDDIKANLHETYTTHILQKQSFRAKRSERKQEAQKDALTIACATFDLQQVINLPISNESAVFYKRRLSVYNFTIYEMVSHDCFCYTWHEGQSKRGASEISTALYLFLKSLDEKGIQKVYLFADGCSGQNKNSIVAATLLYVINNSLSVQEIVLSISVPCHGQNEGDSAHSAIDYAIKKSGDIFLPSRRQPYIVTALSYSDFLDFKALSQNLRLLSVRKDDTGEMVDWRQMMELSFMKTDPNKFFFKTDHTAVNSRSLTLRRQVSGELHSQILPLNVTQPKISQEKYNDLMALTAGDTPVIRLPEFVSFYRSLHH
ncbi:unnamed protein product [Arctia plantaginis]|uniref:Uncharacterized protein n=1 Tax=Arctia plantaginis TaxID=874455 RepID=A0A8S1AT66_ARCPL|nr:unnamed protein product [Arctia plantaginis]